MKYGDFKIVAISFIIDNILRITSEISSWRNNIKRIENKRENIKILTGCLVNNIYLFPVSLCDPAFLSESSVQRHWSRFFSYYSKNAEEFQIIGILPSMKKKKVFDCSVFSLLIPVLFNMLHIFPLPLKYEVAGD